MNATVERLSAALSGRYRIERPLGEGGMATVYLATDLRHERSVALKVLKPELAAVIGAERFLTEIKTTANLQHPHILPLFDSGETDGVVFYVMPYVEGESLADRLERDRQLPVDEAVGIAAKVAGALQAAHDRGVIHRDIKPANILLANGEPLVSDFGIALAVTSGGGGRLTETGLSLGTPHYMSPEQATGDLAVAGTTDIYALGCVLYEMLVGDPPYTGSTAQAILDKIIQGEPVSATAARRTVPPNVDAAIRCALEKVPADRFGTAAAFARALADPGFSHEVASGQGRAARPPSPGRASSRAAPWAVGAAATALASWGWLRPGAPEPVRHLHLDIDSEVRVGRFAAVSPDGSQIVYVGPDLQLYQRALDARDPVPIPGAQPARDSFFSPDGRYVGFNFGSGDADRIATVGLAGGTPIVLGDPEGGISLGGAWLDDGFIYYVTGNNPGGEDPSLVRVPAQGGVPRAVETDAVVVRSSAVYGRTDRLLVVDRSDQVGVGILDLEADTITEIEGLEDAFEAHHVRDFVFWVTSLGALTARAGVVAADLQLGEEVRVSGLTALFGPDDGFLGVYDVAEDGRVLGVAPPSQGALDVEREPPVIVLNVFEEVRRRLGEVPE